LLQNNWQHNGISHNDVLCYNPFRNGLYVKISESITAYL
jgi:hypothetical protein